MHECSVIEQLIKIVTQKAKDNHATKVSKINLIVGEATGYMEESLIYYFNSLPKDSCLENSTISITYIKPKLFCDVCNNYFERNRFSFDCPVCGKIGKMTKIGMEFYIESMEIED
ncbi:MAG: hydrogenase maturation nickel metallochaperone HypA [Spirochaetes bacterium GWC1_27_15]|nr:MAG: hydrogenase maturation nickel metallochaperone HypA [Spirochaetes bacterium GWB1_27_13]OHD27536.1 MAG: hydrogenase maturation nickel metallochaperone HypA [Spirochaetes bacterium GWC1_27_15]